MKSVNSRSILTGIVLAAAGAAAAHAAAEMATNKPDMEYCYGISKGGDNNCATSKHGCATLGKGDYNGQAVKIDGKLLSEGYLGLQSESHPVEFRNIRLLPLP